MIRDHVDRRLADMGGELTLFLAAGVLTVGVSSLALAFPGDWLPYDRLGPTEASATLAIVVAVAAAGVHPIVLVSILAPLLPPITELPNLAAAMFMMAWSIGVSASPLSGTHLILQARYGIPSWHFSRWNVAYCLVMLAVSTAALHLYAGIAG